ncbi:YibE/F family protein [Anaeromicrobium sediminis]|uniref:YibE/F family protein n=1 Tax=Anaeromicrobium sediminis TaxID=1478221 RepID=A0A267MLH5_9FIRM|nr:YibE/F family protein [Anaeromicrobium sediminis]PAB60277.1 YibE/F family protein [Anaeromicrobium sediminis]
MRNYKSSVVMIILMILVVGILIVDRENDSKIEDVFEVKARVMKVNNDNLIQSNIANMGVQNLEVRILEGEFKGQFTNSLNTLVGNLSVENTYKKGDTIIVAIRIEDGKIADSKAIDLYRQNYHVLLFGTFVICLIIFAKQIGIKALFSFIMSLFVIWKFLIPGLLEGKDPLLLSMWVLVLLTAIILFSISGITKKGVAAFVGTITGLSITIGLTLFFGSRMELYGMTAPFAETLMFNGHLDLDMRKIFYAAIVIGASGAAMDIAMDVASSMYEIKSHKPNISMKDLIKSGFNVGRDVVGTMTTTLLLAYSGGYLTLLMLFMDKNSSFNRIINFKIVSAEIMRTVIGSIGLVLVAPITAIVAGIIYSKVKENVTN